MITEFQDGFITKTKLNELVGGINANSERLAELDVIVLTGNTTKTVGVGGDFATLNLAINWCKKVIPNGYKATLNILTGTIIQEYLNFSNVNLRFVEITSIDSTVTIDGNYLIPNLISTYAPFIYSVSSIVPKISFNNTLINEPATSNGVFAFLDKSEMELNYDLTLSGYILNIRLENHSKLTAPSVNILNGTQGVLLFNNSIANMQYSTISTTSTGVYSSWGSNANVVGSTSTATLGFHVSEGGFMEAHGTVGNLSKTENVLTSNGIIFK